MLKLSRAQKVLMVILLLLFSLSWLGFNWAKYACALGLIFSSVLTFLIKTEKNRSNGISSDVLILIAAYFCFFKVQPVIAEKIDTIFWGLFVLEFLVQILALKKFKQPIVLEPFSIRFYNFFQVLFFSTMMIIPWHEVYKWLFVSVGVICNMDHLLIVYWLPYYNPNVTNAYRAFLLNKEYRKIYRG